MQLQLNQYIWSQHFHRNKRRGSLFHSHILSMSTIREWEELIVAIRILVFIGFQSKGKKWYFPLIAHCIDVTEQNAWQIHRYNGGKLDHFTFCRRIALALLETNRRGIAKKRSQSSSLENKDSRYDRLDHIIVPQEKQTRCRQCYKKVSTKCRKCNIALHMRCFSDYHTKK